MESTKNASLLSCPPTVGMFRPNITQISPVLLDAPRIPTVSIPQFKFQSASIRIGPSKNLGEKLAGDVLIGCGVTFTIVPFLTVVDKAIVQSAAGTHSMFASAAESIHAMVRNPTAYLKSPLFLLMWATYAATYSTANSLKTIMEHREFYEDTQNAAPADANVAATNSKLAIFFGTSVVNSAASLMKDRAYAKMYGTSGAAASIPMVTLGLWATRDLIVVGSSFVLPDIMSKHLQENYNMHKGDAQNLSQLTLPVASQFLAGPIQLLGLDFYNRPLTNMTFGEAVLSRARFLAAGFSSVVSARIIRIAPGYGVGGVLNTRFRDSYRDRLIQKEIEQLNETGDAKELVQMISHRHTRQL